MYRNGLKWPNMDNAMFNVAILMGENKLKSMGRNSRSKNDTLFPIPGRLRRKFLHSSYEETRSSARNGSPPASINFRATALKTRE